MRYLLEFWKALDFTSSTSNAFFAFFCTALGYWMSVWWNHRQLEKNFREEKRSLYRSIGFFVADCMITMRDAEVNLVRNMAPHRSLPGSGIEYFQVQLMRYGENDLFVGISTLRSGIEQANQLIPVIIHEFTRIAGNAGLTPAPSDVLRIYGAETIRRYHDLRQHCQNLGRLIDEATVRVSVAPQSSQRDPR